MKSEILPPEYQENLVQENLTVMAELRDSKVTGEKSLHALRPFNPGETLFRFQAKGYLSEPNRYTVQMGENKHILLDPEHLQYINHSCRPNIYFDLPNMAIICLRSISIDDEITFFYPSTEWSMSQAFYCQCGSPTCLGYIRGAQYVPPMVLGKYQLSEFIQQKYLHINPSCPPFGAWQHQR